jgi:hypothetical protein
MSACLNQVVRGLVGDVNGFFNNKAEILRSLFVTKKQFENLIERDCNGNLSGPIQGHTFTEHELDFMDSFLKTFELGLFQLDDFMLKLNSVEGLLRLDECSILYYLRQILNGPWSCAAIDISKILSGNFNMLQSTNDAIGTLGNAVRNNISTVVYGLEPVNAALDLYNHLPPKMQENITNSVKTATNVFNFNQEGAVGNDNTLPYIDKLPILRVNTEWANGFTNFASGNLMLKDVPFFNTLRDMSDTIFGEIENALGVVASKIYRFQKLTNIFAGEANKAFGILTAVNRLLISLDRTEYITTNKIIQKKCEVIKTDIFGNTITNDDTYNQYMQTNSGSYDMWTTDGQSGLRTDSETIQDRVYMSGGQRLPRIDVYDTCEEATNRGRELGCDGCHEHTAATGQVYYMPCKTMEEYQAIMAGIKEPDCDIKDECEKITY